MEALIAKKAQMKQEFINKLRFLSDRATEALAAFTEPGFAGALDQALREAVGAEEPPRRTEKEGPMEQQSQARERQREQPQDRRAEENRRTPERERLSDAGLAARAVLAGGVPAGPAPLQAGGAGRLGGQPGNGGAAGAPGGAR